MRAATEFGQRLRAADRNDPKHRILVSLAAGEPVARHELDGSLGPDLVAELAGDRILVEVGSTIRLVHPLGLIDDVIIALPDQDPPDRRTGPARDFLYLGLDSSFLFDAAQRLAPRGERAADLGAGTGFFAALLSRQYATVVATDVTPRVVAAVRLTMAVNNRDTGHATGAIVANVAAGLRARAFDFVVANPPWVPTAPGVAERVFADGGPTGTELPMQFVRGAAALLRPGGVAVVLALDVRGADGRRPIEELCAELGALGFTTAIVPTPLERALPGFQAKMLDRNPKLVSAVHVAIVVAAPTEGRALRRGVVVAAEALARAWRRWSPDEETSTLRSPSATERGVRHG